MKWNKLSTEYIKFYTLKDDRILCTYEYSDLFHTLNKVISEDIVKIIEVYLGISLSDYQQLFYAEFPEQLDSYFDKIYENDYVIDEVLSDMDTLSFKDEIFEEDYIDYENYENKYDFCEL
jgi:hypothetical protein